VENQPKIPSVAGRPLVKLVSLPRVWVAGIAIVAIAGLGYRWFVSHAASDPRASGSGQSASELGAAAQDPIESLPRVDVVQPQVGGSATSTTQPLPGFVEAYNYANLFAKVSGYLQTQSVDIGDHVKKGRILATIDAPEIVQAAHQAAAELAQSRAQLKANQAALNTAKADVVVARATVEEKEADLKQAAAFFEFHQIQYSRMSDLFRQKALDERAVDENRKERDSSEAAKNLAVAAVSTAKADFGAKEAIAKQAEASVADARAKVEVASAVLEKANVYVSYTQIRSPYNGVVTTRNFHVGDFVRAAEQGGQNPILTVAETDMMRIVVKVPEVYVPLTRPGDRAVFKVNFTDHSFEGKVARVANSLDRTDKTMRTEIDLANPRNELRDGMIGYATIELSNSLKGLSVPSGSLMRKADAKTSLFVVRDGRLKRIAVNVSVDTGSRAEVLSGLKPDDWVVLHPADDLTEGQAVQAVKTKSVRPISTKSKS
jgi:RND family efflux transporter MFP subunit